MTDYIAGNNIRKDDMVILVSQSFIDAARELQNSCECALNVIRYLSDGGDEAKSQIEKIKCALTRFEAVGGKSG